MNFKTIPYVAYYLKQLRIPGNLICWKSSFICSLCGSVCTVRIVAAYWRRLLTPELTSDDCNWFWHAVSCVFHFCPCRCETCSDSFCLFEGKLGICLSVSWIKSLSLLQKMREHDGEIMKSEAVSVYVHSTPLCVCAWEECWCAECLIYLFLYVYTPADTQQWPCRCSTTPDTAPGGGWQWWLL